MPKKVVVIGAGLGGLAAASLLAQREFDVSVYEKNSTPGGKMQQVQSNGYRFDTGPSLFTMPFIAENLFSACGKNLSDYLSYTELSPLCRYFYPDGTIFNNFSDRHKTRAEIEKFAPGDADSYEQFLDHCESLYQKTANAFLFNPLYNLSDLKSLKLSDFFGIDAFSTVSDKVDENVQSAYLRQFFKRFTTYNGSSPYQAPGTLNVIPHVELNQGGYYVDGGLYTIAKSLHQLASDQGVTFHFDTEVTKIKTDGQSITGVSVSGRTDVDCDILFSNSDATDTILHLLPKDSVPKRIQKMHETIEPSCSGFVLMLGCSKTWTQLRHHNIFFSNDYPKEFESIFTRKVMPEDPTIYVANTSVTNSDHAPKDSSNLYILVNAPYVDGQDWEQIRTTYSKLIIRQLENRGLMGLESSIEFKDSITPADFLNRYRSNRGSIYGTSSNSKFAAFLRPRNRLSSFDNLYLVGGSSHPGGGIPLVIQSAFNALELLDRS